MRIGVECVSCGELNVVDVSYLVKEGEFVIESTQSFEDFYSKYYRLLTELPDFPIAKDHLIKIIKKALNVSSGLAHEILERMKIDLDLYENNGIIYSIG